MTIKFWKKKLIDQIYALPEKKIVIIADIGLTNNYLVYIDKIESASTNISPDDYKEYFQQSKIKMANSFFNTYDSYLNEKYKININYKALNKVNSYFRWN